MTTTRPSPPLALGPTLAIAAMVGGAVGLLALVGPPALGLPGVSLAFAVAAGVLGFIAALEVLGVVLRARADRAVIGELQRLSTATADLGARAERLESRLKALEDRPDSRPAPAQAAAEAALAKAAAEQSEARLLQSVVDMLGMPLAPGRGPPPPPRPAPPPKPELAEDLDEDQILMALREAVRSDRIQVFRQPIVMLPQRRPRHWELFSRIRTADGRYLPAGKYLDIAKREGMIAACDNLLLLRAIQATRKDRGPSDLRPGVALFCNLAPSTLADRDFLDELTGFLGLHGDLAEQIVLEVEYQAVGDLADNWADSTSVIRRAGLRLSVDRLPDLEIDPRQLADQGFAYVKLDGRMVLDRAEADGPEAITELLRGLRVAGVTPVIERIEQEKQLVEALDLGFELAQGYLFGEPEPLTLVGDA